MASHQATKKDSKMEETKQTHHSQEPKVLKLAQHFEELGKDSDESGGQKGEQERAQIDLEEIGKYRQQAQQNSMEALMGADEKYQKAKNASLGELLKDAKQAPGGAGEATHTRTPEMTGGPSVKERAGELAWRGGDEQGEEKAKQGHGGGGAGKDMPTRSHETTGYSVKDRAGELTGRRGDEQGKEEAALGELLKDAKQPGEQDVGGGSGKKDTRETTSHFVKDKVGEFTGRQGDQGQGGKEETAGEGEEYVDAPAGEETEHLEGQKGSDYTTAAKDTIVTVGKTVIDYTKHAAEQARDVAANTGGPAIHYIGEKAAGVKDTAVNVSKTAAGTTADIGKSAAGYAGTKVVQAKDVVVETGLRAAHYTLQKAVQVTEGTADVGHKAVEYTGEKTEEAKQEKVQKGEEAQQFAAEAKADVQESKPSHVQESKPSHVQESKPSQVKDEPKYDDYKEVTEGSYSEEPHTEKQGGSFMGAVGEALSEIAQTTKKMVMVKDPDQKE